MEEGRLEEINVYPLNLLIENKGNLRFSISSTIRQKRKSLLLLSMIVEQSENS